MEGNIPDTSPHADHSAGVMVCLQQAALAALEEDDGGVDDLVELAEVEPPAVPGERTLPQALHRHAVKRALDPSRRSVAHHQHAAGLLADLAQTTDGIGQAALVEGVVQATDHADERPCRVNGEEDVVRNDERLEEPGLCDRVGLAVGAVVQQVRGYGVDSGNGERHTDIEEGSVDVCRDWHVLGDDERRLSGVELRGEGRSRKRQVDAAQSDGHLFCCCGRD